MKKLLLVLSLMVVSLSGCYVTPYGVHEDGYRSDRDHREGGDRREGHDDHDGGRGDHHGDRD